MLQPALTILMENMSVVLCPLCSCKASVAPFLIVRNTKICTRYCILLNICKNSSLVARNFVGSQYELLWSICLEDNKCTLTWYFLLTPSSTSRILRIDYGVP